jgi:hypothetical protein
LVVMGALKSVILVSVACVRFVPRLHLCDIFVFQWLCWWGNLKWQSWSSLDHGPLYPDQCPVTGWTCSNHFSHMSAPSMLTSISVVRLFKFLTHFLFQIFSSWPTTRSNKFCWSKKHRTWMLISGHLRKYFWIAGCFLFEGLLWIYLVVWSLEPWILCTGWQWWNWKISWHTCFYSTRMLLRWAEDSGFHHSILTLQTFLIT